jgi:hypothetical protein
MGFWAFSGEHFMDRGEPMFLSNALYKPKRIVSYESAPAVSPDIDRLPATLDIILQTSGTKRVLAHAVRFPKMSVESLAKLSYPAYLDYRNAMQRMIPSFSGSGRQLVWVPIYCAYQAQLMGDQLMTWTLSSLKPSPFIIGDAIRPNRKAAVAEAAPSIEQHRQSAGSASREGAFLSQPDAPELHFFYRPPVSNNPADVAAEAMWRTVKQKYPNEVALAAYQITDLVSPLLDLTRCRPSFHPYSILPPGALSPDIDLMESVLGIVHQAHGISYLYAHSVRVEHMSLSALGNRNYQLYNAVLDVIRRETPDHLVKSSDRFYVPIYRTYTASYTGEFSWSIAARGGYGEVFPEAVQVRRARAVEETLRRLREHLEDKLHKTLTISSFKQLLETPVSVFDKPPLSKDAEAVMVETVWRTLKHKFPNEVALAELAV